MSRYAGDLSRMFSIGAKQSRVVHFLLARRVRGISIILSYTDRWLDLWQFLFWIFIFRTWEHVDDLWVNYRIIPSRLIKAGLPASKLLCALSLSFLCRFPTLARELSCASYFFVSNSSNTNTPDALIVFQDPSVANTSIRIFFPATSLLYVESHAIGFWHALYCSNS